ncbi:50S ribosomal protein L32e [Candidatus Woesearchaeota archaeon]|nr:50S ribosomal protein L32e [Candidatus Woesearchaeota archaeon]
MKEELLKIRIAKKKKKPNFIRQDTNKKIRLRNKAKWRKPKGRHSKLRLGKKGHEAVPSTGWGSPREVKHLHKSGLRQILVQSLNDFDQINKNEEGVILGSTVGKRKKIELIKKAEEIGVRILNIRNTKDFVDKIQKEREEKKRKKEEKIAEKSKKKAKPKKEEKKEVKKEEIKETSEEAKKKEEKKEKDKILTKKT